MVNPALLQILLQLLSGLRKELWVPSKVVIPRLPGVPKAVIRSVGEPFKVQNQGILGARLVSTGEPTAPVKETQKICNTLTESCRNANLAFAPEDYMFTISPGCVSNQWMVLWYLSYLEGMISAVLDRTWTHLFNALPPDCVCGYVNAWCYALAQDMINKESNQQGTSFSRTPVGDIEGVWFCWWSWWVPKQINTSHLPALYQNVNDENDEGYLQFEKKKNCTQACMCMYIRMYVYVSIYVYM